MADLLVLDFGGVISKTLFETHRQSEEALGLPTGSLTWRGPFDLASDALWCDMLAGKLSERDYWLYRAQEVGAMLGKNWRNMHDLVLAVRSDRPMDIIRPECLSAIARVKRLGKRLAILSNELDLFYGNALRKKLPFLAEFDPIVDATYTNILKPDLRAYRLITESTLLSPKQCVFMDDQASNIKGAIEFGMKTVHFDVSNPQASYDAALAKLGEGR